MLVLLDTGILLRLFDRLDPHYSEIRASIRLLRANGDEAVIAPQNAVEFWNVSTRPTSARGGFGQSVAKTRARLMAIERISRVLPETSATFSEWKRLVDSYSIVGVAVHDARLVAQMTVWHVAAIVTLNPADFRRYSGIIIRTPAELLNAGALA